MCPSTSAHMGWGMYKAKVQTLFLAIVHAILPCQGLYQVLQGQVPCHVVAMPDGALHLEQNRCEGPG